MYDIKLKEISAENRQLRSKVDKLSKELSTKIVEFDEAREMNGIYSARYMYIFKYQHFYVFHIHRFLQKIKIFGWGNPKLYF